jgi:predicted Rossmann fold nucleotide-binding protein DprA/Smf involved in DNA uptake
LPNKLQKIISGGQTGADRAAWDAAIEAGIATGGSVPKGRQAEDGPIAGKYPGLTETASPDPMERTRLNVIDSDATLLFSHGPPTGGSRLTAELTEKYNKPLLHIDLAAAAREGAVERVADWLRSTNICVLNVAGPRASEDPSIYEAVREFLVELFSIL